MGIPATNADAKALVKEEYINYGHERSDHEDYLVELCEKFDLNDIIVKADCIREHWLELRLKAISDKQRQQLVERQNTLLEKPLDFDRSLAVFMRSRMDFVERCDGVIDNKLIECINNDEMSPKDLIALKKLLLEEQRSITDTALSIQERIKREQLDNDTKRANELYEGYKIGVEVKALIQPDDFAKMDEGASVLFAELDSIAEVVVVKEKPSS
jgi:hypothetical protein